MRDVICAGYELVSRGDFNVIGAIVLACRAEGSCSFRVWGCTVHGWGEEETLFDNLEGTREQRRHSALMHSSTLGSLARFPGGSARGNERSTGMLEQLDVKSVIFGHVHRAQLDVYMK
ncbi:hypothetical protein P171DRAFT_220438 [Karstenula rhodostoma CBS 690.94]|uniref:Calcineurin-like phosphoesterase domain-containing protein n=1 Tax=Karstenula rhodostoma CBS 690.94 TaxID=1392251 RepID=A0A9P4UFS7_9PLEO|nr:hypothetical protein P171DRAFT_220438 [Karstenula rhodostoma CBS 690.94]